MDDGKVFIIAEAGVNHNGSVITAKKLVDAAVNANVDAIKFQIFNAARLVTKQALKAAYQLQASRPEESQFDMLKKLELDDAALVELHQYCTTRKLVFIASVFDEESIDWLSKFNLPIVKIPSGEIENLPYLRKIGRLNKKIILSTGMSTMTEIENALHILIENGTSKDKITVLHCNTAYPTPIQDVNLRAMLTIKNTLHVAVGYSDHTTGIEIPIAAVAMGATVIEKHFTLNQAMPGPDHAASLNPCELKAMVEAIRKTEMALGQDQKIVSPSEAKNQQAARKSIIAKTNIQKNELFSELNLTTKRPGNGISPMRWDAIMGMPALKDYSKDELI